METGGLQNIHWSVSELEMSHLLLQACLLYEDLPYKLFQ